MPDAVARQLGNNTLVVNRDGPALFFKGGGDKVSNLLSLTMQQQEQKNWCWAAVATSVARFLDNTSTLTQCILASQQLDQPSNGCCTDGDNPATCDKVAYLEASLLLAGHLGPEPNPLPTIASPERIKQEIDAGRPIGARIGWGDSADQGHYILIVGYDDSTLEFTLKINDPADPDGSPPNTYSYSALQQGYKSASGTWTHTYFTI